MADSEGKTRRVRLPRTVLVCAVGGFCLVSVSAAGAYVAGAKMPFIGKDRGDLRPACTLIERVRFRAQDGNVWTRAYIAIAPSDGPARLRATLDAARAEAAEHPVDLVLVVAGDTEGPKRRILMRDTAVGARVVYAPHPDRIAPGTRRFQARYVDARPSADGDFYGKTKVPDEDQLVKIVAKDPEPTGCTPTAGEAKDADAAKGAGRSAAQGHEPSEPAPSGHEGGH
ncbi:hypothetical protein [Pararhizobium mangrovi]|uniref:Uncharacterized protein n=1 Tax=Pararhizobium mangrovi TaxID=2590452 RepID=A0A506UA02_9HYPH|nr:hypothetical protein [Pararhizobium mangrovi]TPW30700.1 hypothetical protein FJU11_04555 [Pararhizobium mangrovi]